MKNKKNELRLETGNEVINIICPSIKYKESMEEYFQVVSSQKEPDISIRLSVKSHKDQPNIPDSCFTEKKMTKNSFTIRTDLVKCSFERDKKRGRLHVKTILTKAPYTRVFEQLLYQACYSSIKSKEKRAYLIHSSGVIADNNGYLFTGASGKGKTTIADLSANYHVLNDEINIIEFDKEGVPWLIGTPFNGLYKNKKPGKAVCKAVFLLNHGETHEIKEVAYQHAVKTIMREIVPPIGLDEFIDQKTLLKSLDIAEEIAKAIPVFDLYFKKDPGFWDLIRENTKG